MMTLLTHLTVKIFHRESLLDQQGSILCY